MYQSTKTYDHNLGLSCTFRQWRADSHCRLLHGYALSFKLVFEATHLDERNWVIDFGALDKLKDKLRETFDHKLLVAGDDPKLEVFAALHRSGIADVLILPGGVGCEAFARLGWSLACDAVRELGQWKRVRVVSCEAREHGANSAIYIHADTGFGER